MTSRYVMAIDQGTTSTRCILFDASGRLAAVAQSEHRQYYPAAGWVEHDAVEIWRNLVRLMPRVRAQVGPDAEIVGIGIANQRETTVLWDRTTGRPVGRAVVWQDTRTDELVAQLRLRPNADRVATLSGLPVMTYFAAPRIRWLLDENPELRPQADAGELLFGTIETWLIWNLTGGLHVTDVTNASRTMLMNLETLDWDDELLAFFDIPRAMLPDIRSNAEVYGRTVHEPQNVPIAAAIGDQHAALFGQACFEPGETKCTYGTGGFLLRNTGTTPVRSSHGLLTTVGFQIGSERANYSLEGSIAVTGSLVQWLRDQLGIIDFAPEVETLAAGVPDNGGCYIVPAFSGLFAPHWRSEARGVIAGLTSFVNRGHLARAVLEATAWQTREVVDAMNADFELPLPELNVDGGMTSNNLLMQTIADVLDVPVVRPLVAETVSRGAAFAAGLVVGLWADTAVLRTQRRPAARWSPRMTAQLRESEFGNWQRAVELAYQWQRR